MGFETKVLAVVEEIMGDTDSAGFAYGTLWVGTFDKTEAKRILKALNAMNVGKVVMTFNKQVDEYSYDFV